MEGNGVVQTEWWLMDCSLPDLNWARLRVYNDGHADVFDVDGNLDEFDSREDAKLWLLEDEYISLANMDEDDVQEFGLEIRHLKPPQATSDESLVHYMYVNHLFIPRD